MVEVFDPAFSRDWLFLAASMSDRNGMDNAENSSTVA
jgi:hypothetical protein